MHAEHCLGGDFSYYIYWCCSQHCRNKGWRVGERRFYLWWYHRVEDCACITCSTIRLCPSIVVCTHAFLCIPFPSRGGRGIHWISSDRDDQRIFWGLRFSIPGICLGRKIWQVFFWVAWFKWGFFGGFKTVWRFVLKKPRSSWVSRVLLEWLPDAEQISWDGMVNKQTQAFNV